MGLNQARVGGAAAAGLAEQALDRRPRLLGDCFGLGLEVGDPLVKHDDGLGDAAQPREVRVMDQELKQACRFGEIRMFFVIRALLDDHEHAMELAQRFAERAHGLPGICRLSDWRAPSVRASDLPSARG